MTDALCRVPRGDGATTPWRLPRRCGVAAEDSWAWFLAVAMQSRSAFELLGAVLRRQLIVVPLRRHEFSPGVLPELLRMLGVVPAEEVAWQEHLLIDGDPPHRTIGRSLALVVPGRLPADVRWSSNHRGRSVSQLLDACGSYWTADLLRAEELSAAASFFSDGSPDVRMVRLTRRLSLIGTPVAVVVDEIPQPAAPARGREVPLPHR